MPPAVASGRIQGLCGPAYPTGLQWRNFSCVSAQMHQSLPGTNKIVLASKHASQYFKMYSATRSVVSVRRPLNKHSYIPLPKEGQLNCPSYSVVHASLHSSQAEAIPALNRS